MLRFKFGGCEKVFIDLAKSINYNIYLVLINNDIDDELIKQLPDNVTVIHYGCNGNFIKRIILAIKRIKRFFNGKPVVTINFNDTLSTLLTTIITSNKQAISWIHCQPNALKKSRSFFLYKYLLKRASKIVTICYAQKNLLINEIPTLNSDKIFTIYNPINIDNINNLKNASDKLSISKNDIVTVARLDTRSKDFYNLIDAFALSLPNIPSEVKLFIVGEGPDRKLIEDYITKAGLTNQIILVGQQNNPYEWINNAHCFILSSNSEGLSIVILEALSCNQLVISTDCEVGPKEILKSSVDCGILVPIKNYKALADAIIETYKEDFNKSYYIENAKKRILDFSMEAFKQNFDRLIF